MKIDSGLTDEAVLAELGRRLAAVRLARNLTQAALAEQAGISLRTLSRLENGEVATQLSSLIRVSRALGLVGGFEALVPPPLPSPLDQLDREGRQRQRASGERATDASADGGSAPADGAWQWAES